MCNFSNPPVKYEGETFTGYKRVVIVNGLYISPATGVVYTEGKEIPKPRLYRKQVIDDNFIDVKEMVCKTGYCYSPELKGRTSVYVNKHDALKFRKRGESIVELTISGELIVGMYGRKDIVAGRKIEKIGEVIKFPQVGENIKLNVKPVL